MAVIYTFKGTLELIGALHIGSGGGDAQTDATVVRDVRGNPYIPGSSLRGAFRAAVERLAPALLATEASHLENESFWRDLRNDLDRRNDEASIIDALNGKLNCLDRLFGSPFWASPLLIPDLRLENNGPAKGYHEIRHGVGIDRDTGAARDAIKYDFEVLPKGYAFAFLMRCEIPDDAQAQRFKAQWLQALAIGLQLLRQSELMVGGRQARGVGQVQLRDLSVYILDTSQKDKLISALLKSGAEDARYGEAEDGAKWIAAQLHTLKGA